MAGASVVDRPFSKHDPPAQHTAGRVVPQAIGAGPSQSSETRGTLGRGGPVRFQRSRPTDGEVAVSQRWGMGPVFAFESLLNARRWQVYAGRSFFVVVLLLGMVFVWFGNENRVISPVANRTFQQMAKIGEGFFYA